MLFLPSEYGKRIRALREGLKKTQEQMANDLQITDVYLRRIESGKSIGSIELIIEISFYLGVSLDYLLLGKSLQDERLKRELLSIAEELRRLAGDE